MQKIHKIVFMANDDRVLVKLRPSNALRAAESRVNIRPLYRVQTSETIMGLTATPDWYVADLSENAVTPWDLAHTEVARQLGVAESDVLFAEPDIVHDVYRDANETAAETTMGIGSNCEANPPDGSHGKALGPDHVAWHLAGEFSRLNSARDAVKFTDARTPVAHLDTGYFRAHIAVPEFVVHTLERNFVLRAANPNIAEDPDNRVLV